MKPAKQPQEDSWLQEQRAMWLKKFNESEQPLFKYGIGIHTDLRHISFEDLPPRNPGTQQITNGEHANILSFTEALHHHPQLIKKYLTSPAHEHKLLAFHNAHYNQGTFITIPAHTHLTQPLMINLSLEGNTHIESKIIIAEPGSKATIIDTTTTTNQKFNYYSQLLHLILHEGAHITYVNAHNLNTPTHSIAQRHAYLHKNSTLTWINCSLGGTTTHTSTTTHLLEEGATAHHHTATYGTGTQHFDFNHAHIHHAPHTTSTLTSKTALHQKAKAITRGLIKIEKNSHHSKGSQHHDALLLSEEANVDAVPTLEIHNNDVQCTHGSTISEIDEEHLFYLTSRGLHKQQAQHLILEGFFSNTLNHLKNQELAHQFSQAFQKQEA